ncbi:hypothetical protein [Dictyobacter kobayashii]|uniref:Uncharacterized protein n=1 Tax=Dictyobacter kobayashii TaxID=2014872 RepID=A0A402ATP4_9CHLR|nr:hypothetical protein [Dictyobacter kobayashii]GCE22482.1 hypothetical protein KDK_62820 [Dictyobacter kobayashii]
MQDTIGTKEMKRLDPIWRQVWVGRIWKFLWLAYTVGYLIFYIAMRSWQQQGFYFLLLAFFNMLVSLIIVANEFRQEHYWRRIGERRQAALQDPTALRARSQPVETELALQLPVTIRLRWKRAFWIGGLVILLIMVGAPLILGVYLGGGQRINFMALAIVFGVMAGILLIAFLLAYFFFFRYQPQSIELTDEGITTRYLRHQRSLRWEEARVFAQYQRGVFNRNISGITYELSNAQTVVRWSQQAMTATYLRVESNQTSKDDFNWLLNQVAAYVAQRTGLPLLDFNDQQPAGKGAAQANMQVDPLTPHLTLRKEQLLAFGLLGAFAIILIILAISGNLFPNLQHMSSGTSNVFTGMMLIGGILILLSVGFSLWIFLMARRYWMRINQRRTLSAQEPARYQVQPQLLAVNTPPQPGKLKLQMSRGFLFGLTFGISFIIIFALMEALLRQTGLYLLIILLVAVFISLFSSIVTMALTGKRYQRRIEVWSNGITSSISVLESQMGWQEARRFQRYRGLRLLPGRAKLEIYELVGDNTVVRWHWMHNRLRFVNSEPKMSPEEYDQWMEQMTGYIIERTGLPLLDLDTSDQP